MSKDIEEVVAEALLAQHQQIVQRLSMMVRRRQIGHELLAHEPGELRGILAALTEIENMHVGPHPKPDLSPEAISLLHEMQLPEWEGKYHLGHRDILPAAELISAGLVRGRDGAGAYVQLVNT